jgi:hypothetical protein
MDLIKLDVHHVDKTQFLSALLSSRNKAFYCKEYQQWLQGNWVSTL